MTASQRKRFDPLPLIQEEVPYTLQRLGRFVVWRAFTAGKPDGKADKVPVDIFTGRKVSAFDSRHQMSFTEAVEAYEAGAGNGIGIVLDGQPVGAHEDGSPLYLVGIDLDDVFAAEDTESTALKVVSEVNSYTELSPSGRGIRIFCTSTHKPRSGQTEYGEIYAEKRFLTITGHRIGLGVFGEATDAVSQIEKRWLGDAATTKAAIIPFPDKGMDLTRKLSGDSWGETNDNMARISELLGWIPPDSPYEIWRDCIWALASLGWDCGQQLAEEWSAGSLAHWEHDEGAEAQNAICSLFDSFDTNRGISAGTLFFHAYANGMPRNTPQTAMATPNPSTAAGGFFILSRDALDALPPLSWTVRGVLPASGLAAIYGEPGSGKSFLAIDLAARISAGLPDWFGHQIFQRDVVYTALEGGRGIQQRVAAWDSLNAVRADRVKFLLSGFTLLSEADVVRLADTLKVKVSQGAVIIIDTLAQATPGADENTGKDMGLVLQAAKYIADAVDGLVILVHHSGKDSSRGLRGHSSLNGAMDAVINVARDNVTDRRSWRVTKMKDAEDGATGHFTLDRVDLWADGFGGRVTSSAVKEIKAAAAVLASAQQAPLGGNQKLIYDALQGHPKASSGWNQKELTDLTKAALSDVSSKHRASRARDALKGLIDGGIIKKNEGGIFILNQKSPDHPPPAPP
jgi:hypothetical protein